MAASGKTQRSSAEGAEADLDNGDGEPAPRDRERSCPPRPSTFAMGAAGWRRASSGDWLTVG
jgi:hypothetical protein